MLVSVAEFSVCCIPVYFFHSVLGGHLNLFHFLPPVVHSVVQVGKCFSRVLPGCLGLQLLILLDT